MEAVIGSQTSGAADRQIVSLTQDSFYRELDEKEIQQAKKGTFNFDHPGMCATVLLLQIRERSSKQKI